MTQYEYDLDFWKTLDGMQLPNIVDLQKPIRYGSYNEPGFDCYRIYTNGVYGDISPVIIITSSLRADSFTASVCMDQLPNPNCFWVKNWSENEGVLEAFLALDCFILTGRKFNSGFVTAYEVKYLGKNPEIDK